jgi:formylglycine-generating enzyme required for sulfatase activity
VAAAISQRRWNDALAIEPDNAAALVGRAQTKLAANPADVEGAFSDLDLAERQPGAAEIVQPARAEAHAVRAVEQAQADRLDRATEDLRVAEAGGATAQLLARAQQAIATGWIGRGEQAVANGDAALVSSAADYAATAGATEEALTPLRARAVVLEALALQSKGDINAAVSAIIEAAILDAAYVRTILDQPPYASLRKGVVAEYRDRFDAEVTRKDWQEAVRMAAAAQMLGKASDAWVSQAVAVFPPAALASLPPAALASLPPAALAVLPPLRNSVGMAMKLLPAGTFTMGQQGYGSDETPHEVTLTKPFYIGVYEVTNAEWERVMGSAPSSRKEDNHPVEQVSWSDAVEFCSKLSALPEERVAGREYRLPTEAEWEYGCRAGTTTTFSFGDDEQQLEAYGWYKRNSFKDIWANDGKVESRTSPVGMKTANTWGLYDMHGNVREYCSDLYGWSKTDHVSRGGSWLDSPNDCRSSSRFSDHKSVLNGFRIAMSPSGLGSPTGVSAD